MELLKIDTLEAARGKLLAAVGEQWIKTVRVPLKSALNCVLAQDLYGKINIPDFRRSMVDGYAVIAKDTMGAGESIPVFLKVIGDVPMGEAADCVVTSGTCAYVPTGGMIPEGADACVMVEYCEQFDSDEIAVYQATSVGRYVVEVGEDSKAGELLFKRGTKLRPQEIGALSAEGFTEVEVFAPPKVFIISTGDELTAPGELLEKGQIYDINTSALEALAVKHGFEVAGSATVKDQYGLLKETIASAKEKSDLVVISGGSSKGKKDMTAMLIDELAEPGVFTHGLALKPGKPTILGIDEKEKTLMAGLPGHPVAAMAVFEMLMVWLKRKLTGEPEKGRVPAVLTGNVPGAPGRQTLLFVELEQTEEGYLAKPIFGKSGLMSTMTKADGYTAIEMLQEGLKSGEKIWVHTF